ncbi:hypothetical protein NEOC95_000421 [Neochlamydia sp. AcF95]|nr:hypothetical protein [Neochlamydia sp. AcF95]
MDDRLKFSLTYFIAYPLIFLCIDSKKSRRYLKREN